MAEFLSFPGSKDGFAIGLLWQHEETPPSRKSLRATALEIGRSFRWAVVHESPEGAIQSGFCEPIPGIKPANLKALAAVVASHHRAPWNGIFHLEGNRYWYVAVRQGHAVIAGGDRIGTLEELSAIRAHHRGLGDWTEVDGTLADLVPMTQAAKSVSVLRDVQSGPWKSATYAAAAVVGLTAITAGAWYWYDQQQAAEREAQLAKQRAFAAAQRANASAKRQALPWPGMPMPSAILDACRTEWNAQALAVSGWTLASWRCTPSGNASLAIETSWRREGGLALNAPGSLSADGNHGTATRTAPAAFGASPPSILTIADAQRAVWTYAQGHGLQLQLSMPPALLPSDGSTPVEPWLAMTADFSFGAAPWLGLAEGLDAVAGLRVTEVSYDAGTQAWKGIAKLFASRESGTVPIAANQTVGN